MRSTQPLYRLVAVTAISLLLAGLMAACGDSSGNNAPAQQTPVGSAAATGAATTGSATTPAAPATTAAVAATTAPANAASTTTAAPASTTVAAKTTTPATTTQAAIATTVAAATQAPALPTVGNNYPAGPAPAAGPQFGGATEVTLQVPQQFKNGRWTTPRKLQVPTGFNISLYSVLPGSPRFGVVSPDGQLFVSLRDSGRIVVLKDNGQGAAQDPITFATGLNGPHGLAFHEYQGQMYLYTAENNRVSRFNYKDGQTKADNRETIVQGIPSGGGHSTRSIAFGPDGKMYISAGSTCNVCQENDPRRAAITQYNADGTGERVFASGLRNEVGIAFNPQTGELWGTENSRDSIGNDIPPEEINVIKDGSNYGWPYCYSNQVYDKAFGGKNEAYCKTTVPPALPMQAHSAPLGITFYFGQQFPQAFQGSAFVAFHGSWNRDEKTGYKVVRIVNENNRPVRYEDFVTGWLQPGGEWGRPVDVIAAPDGSLFITDDSANAVYRVTYAGKSGA